ncbi:uncharacterized protein LOC9646144 [Selaginella moellendorffii]|uniref:uncharacterized protein LOC9646144 n=1 Tax=Selaginella moellendorffii TaxID=88036 RepID=UPI000D1CB5F9|nr:uncharacterized protein LOC9646144 [Selaginella moellendorffii]|eukprot:XP_024522346.1 uncharacterized protein LOC9646144 [Selaginella moellendorffii]
MASQRPRHKAVGPVGTGPVAGASNARPGGTGTIAGVTSACPGGTGTMASATSACPGGTGTMASATSASPVGTGTVVAATRFFDDARRGAPLGIRTARRGAASWMRRIERQGLIPVKCRSRELDRLMLPAILGEGEAWWRGAVVDLDRSSSTHDSSRWENHFQLVADHLKLLGLEEPVSKLSVIHVAGTKGKGSTCAFVERILRASGFRTALFTSPHLLDIRERFRLNGEEVSEETFNKYFWWCWDHLQANEAPYATSLSVPHNFSIQDVYVGGC